MAIKQDIAADMLQGFEASPRKMELFREQIYAQIDALFLYVMMGFFGFGLVLGGIYGAWWLALGMGASLLLSYFLVSLLKARIFKRYLYGLLLCLYACQLIAQAHGMPLMHGILPLSVLALSLYGNWRISILYLVFALSYYLFGLLGGNSWLGWSEANMVLLEATDTMIILVLLAFGTVAVSVVLSQRIHSRYNTEASMRIYLDEQLNVEKNTQLAKQIAEGEFDRPYLLREHDQMGVALLDMRERLRRVHEIQQEQQWTSEGLEHVNELLLSVDQIDELARCLMTLLAQYSHALIGAIYVKDDVKDVLLLKASYAHNRQLHINSEIAEGEGIVGECMRQKKTILMADAQQYQWPIQSGLGEAKPEVVLVIPMTVKDEVKGVLEMAFLSAVRPYEQRFLERACENIAVSLLSLQAAGNTKRLLQDAQLYNEQMRTQEEEMRSNVEEMRTIQEELSRQIKEKTDIQAEVENRMNAVGQMAALSEIDLQGRISYVNQRFCELTKYSEKECIGQPYSLLRHPEASDEAFQKMEGALAQGQAFLGEIKCIDKLGRVLWLELVAAPIFNAQRQTKKHLVVAFDITKLKQKEAQIDKLISDAKIKNDMLNFKEEMMQKNLEALEIAERELTEQLGRFASQKDLYERALAVGEVAIYRSVLDRVWSIEYISPSIANISGYPNSDFIGQKVRSFDSLIHPDDKKAMHDAAGKGSANFRAKYRIQHAGGQWVWIEEQGQLTFDPQKKKDLMLGMIKKIYED